MFKKKKESQTLSFFSYKTRKFECIILFIYKNVPNHQFDRHIMASSTWCKDYVLKKTYSYQVNVRLLFFSYFKTLHACIIMH